MIEDEIFKKSIFVEDKCKKFGFQSINNSLEYTRSILNNSFDIIVTVKDNKVRGKIIDKELEEEYISFRVENQIGEFANTIRDEFIKLLEEIRDKCTIQNNFVSNQANRISAWIKNSFQDNPEYLWDDDSNAVFRNKSNKKWYGIIMRINKNKLDKEDKMVEVMNVKLPPEFIDELVKKEGYYRAYHMNKKYWITFILDDTVKDNELEELIKQSYQYTIETKDWVIPANPKYWDIIHCFDDKDEIEWKQIDKIELLDYVYIYVGSPYSCMMYKCQVVEKDIPSKYIGIDYCMRIKKIKQYKENEYPFEKLKSLDLRAVRGPRRMPINLLKEMNKNE